jgi:hypothetical protein
MIICSGVIQHTKDPAKVLINFSRWLKKGGVLRINCYRSGILKFFMHYLVRDLIQPYNISYKQLYHVANLYKGAFFDKNDFLDSALVPFLKATSYSIIRGDLEKTGFSIIKDDKEYPIHSTSKCVIDFIVRKKDAFEVNIENLSYRGGIDQLSLDYGRETKDIIDLYYKFKEKILSSQEPRDMVIVAALEIANSFYECHLYNEMTFRQKLRKKLHLMAINTGISKSIKDFLCHSEKECFFKMLTRIFNDYLICE